MKTGSEFHVGIVGLGSMGMGAALSCVRAGLSTWGADLNSNACATLKEAGACGVSDNAATFAEKLDALLVLVVNAAQVKQVLFGETGVAQHLKPGTAVMVSSTIASADAQEIATALAGFDLEMLEVSCADSVQRHRHPCGSQNIPVLKMADVPHVLRPRSPEHDVHVPHVQSAQCRI